MFFFEKSTWDRFHTMQSASAFVWTTGCNQKPTDTSSLGKGCSSGKAAHASPKLTGSEGTIFRTHNHKFGSTVNSTTRLPFWVQATFFDTVHLVVCHIVRKMAILGWSIITQQGELRGVSEVIPKRTTEKGLVHCTHGYTSHSARNILQYPLHTASSHVLELHTVSVSAYVRT